MTMTTTATRLIKRFGQTATLVKPGPFTGPPHAPEQGPDVEHAVTVAVTDYSLEQRAGNSIADSDLRVFMTAGIEPTTSDKLRIDETIFYVTRVATLGPDGVVICYELQVRK